MRTRCDATVGDIPNSLSFSASVAFGEWQRLGRRAERDLIGAWQLPRVRPVRSPVAPTVNEADQMIVIGVDVHKHSLTAVAVDEPGRMLDERRVAAAGEGLLGLAHGVGAGRGRGLA